MYNKLPIVHEGTPSNLHSQASQHLLVTTALANK
jgi:hypothetical protein